MKHKSKPSDLMDAICGLTGAMKPAARKLTKGQRVPLITSRHQSIDTVRFGDTLRRIGFGQSCVHVRVVTQT